MRARWKAIGLATVFCVAFCCRAQYEDRDYSRFAKTAAHAPAPEDRIDINHASVEQMLKAPGMTRTWAERIARFRPYRTKQDLLERGVVSGEIYDRIKDYVIAHQKAQ